MKKKERKDQEQNQQPRRLRLDRETILVLDDPALLGGARGGLDNSCPRTSITGGEE